MMDGIVLVVSEKIVWMSILQGSYEENINTSWAFKDADRKKQNMKRVPVVGTSSCLLKQPPYLSF